MERDLMLEYLKGSKIYYEELEKMILTYCPNIDLVVKGATIEKSSFRFYYKGKFIVYCNVYYGFFDVMTRFSAADAYKIDDIISDMSDYALEVWNNRYPCGTGAWIHYCVNSEAKNAEAMTLLKIKLSSVIGE